MNGSGGKRRFLLILCFLGVALFGALGVWQVERRAWKLDLIERVNARIHAPPVAVPPRGEWHSLNPQDVEYRRVRASGVFLHDRETLVDALTERGAGSWVVTPLRTDDGVILVNRGFVPPERRARATRQAGQERGAMTVTGLLRLPEPGGRFLRPNKPAAERWYSRDVAEIARVRKLGPVAPFFIDADSTPNPGGVPVGGLTVVQFRNAHLVYAITWFGLAALCTAGLIMVARSRKRS